MALRTRLTALAAGWGPAGAVAPLLLFLGIFFLLPLLGILWDSFDGRALDFGSYVRVFADQIYLKVLRRTFEIGAKVTLLCILFGYPVAYLLTVVGRRMATVLTLLVMVPLFTALLIRTYAWMIILGRHGIINDALVGLGLVDQPLELLHTSTAVYVGMVHVLSPIAIFTMYANMAQIDRRLVQAAAVLGADPVRGFLRVYLPMSLPGTIAAAVLVFVMAIGFYITPALLGGPADAMISQLIIAQTTALLNFELGFALAVVLLIATLLTLAVAGLFIPLELLWTSERRLLPAGAGGRAQAARRRLGALAGLLLQPLERWLARLLRPVAVLLPALLRLYGVAAMVFMAAPLLIVFILSFSASEFLVFPPPGFSWQWYEKFMAARDWHAALGFSIELAVVVAAVAVLIGATGAFGLVRARLPGRRFIFLLTLSPVIMPVIILALALYSFEARIRLLGSFPGLVIGHVVLALPYVVVVMIAAVRGLDPDLEHAAAVLGARPTQTLRRVLVPLLRPSLLTAGFFAFLVSFDELLITLFLIGRQTQTLPLKFWADIKFQIDPLLSAASSLIIAAIVLLILLGQWLRRRAERRSPPAAGAAA
jgi:ABC-type spermidine/putrescine transport system permease subunit I